MPTPFTHLEIAQRLLRDSEVPARFCDALRNECGAFLLGNIAADARVGSGAPRDSTHFYQYRVGIQRRPWRVMVGDHPSLMTPHDPAQRAFVAGYVAHLSVDETWSLMMVTPHIAGGDWGHDIRYRFYVLHLLLMYMDERDFAQLESWQAGQLKNAAPDRWSPFLPDQDLRDWQDFIYEQIKPDGGSQTLAVLGARIGKTEDELRAILDSPQTMQDKVWGDIPRALLAEVEACMYDHARKQLIRYMNLTASPG